MIPPWSYVKFWASSRLHFDNWYNKLLSAAYVRAISISQVGYNTLQVIEKDSIEYTYS